MRWVLVNWQSWFWTLSFGQTYHVRQNVTVPSQGLWELDPQQAAVLIKIQLSSGTALVSLPQRHLAFAFQLLSLPTLPPGCSTYKQPSLPYLLLPPNNYPISYFFNSLHGFLTPLIFFSCQVETIDGSFLQKQMSLPGAFLNSRSLAQSANVKHSFLWFTPLAWVKMLSVVAKNIF